MLNLYNRLTNHPLKSYKLFYVFKMLKIFTKGMGAIYEMRWFAGSGLCSGAQHLPIVVEGR